MLCNAVFLCYFLYFLLFSFLFSITSLLLAVCPCPTRICRIYDRTSNCRITVVKNYHKRMPAPRYMKTLTTWQSLKEWLFLFYPKVRPWLFIINDSGIEDEHFAVVNTIFNQIYRIFGRSYNFRMILMHKV